MRFHLLQHVDFETPAAIKDWICNHGYSFTTTRFFCGDPLPAQSDFDILIILGGPMGVKDEQQFPWLCSEKNFIQEAIAAGKYIVGICLGAQLIASALGAEVTKNPHREIGWFPITVLKQQLPAVLKDVFQPAQEVFHWHDDTFDIPQGAIHFASSEACAKQAFILNERVIGFQFHIETTQKSATLLVQNCGDDLDDSCYVQSVQEILSTNDNYNGINQVLRRLLDNMVKLVIVEK